jgi:ABC-type sugar transport system ATPase subunit
MGGVSFRGVRKQYPDGTEAVKGLTLDIEDGEFMVLVGPSGSGKTTALRMVAGLEKVTEGEIEIGGRVVNDVAPRDRDIAMVFQNYALYPHMTAADNMAFGLRLRGMPKQDRAGRVGRTSTMLGLESLLDKRPRFLSGGQRQRVAMGRAVVRDPAVFLMDEPLSNLDAQLRVQMRAEIHELQRSLGVTTLYVTHDQVEAMTLGDRVAVFDHGELQQVAAPADLYRHPATMFVAGFVGNPPMNFLPAKLVPTRGDMHAEFAGGAARLDPRDADSARRRRGSDRLVMLGLRPEALAEAHEGAAGRISGTVELVELLGADALVHITPDDPHEGIPASARRLVARVPGEAHDRLSHGDRYTVGFSAESVHLFDAETGVAFRPF